MEHKRINPRKVIKVDGISLESVVKAARERGVDVKDIKEKAGGNWRRITPLLERAYGADLLTGGNALGEFGAMVSVLLRRQGDFNGWLLQFHRISETAGPVEFADRIHELSTQVLEENIRNQLGVPKKIDGAKGRRA